MIFGKVERRRTERTSSESLTKRAKIVALWRVLTQSPVARLQAQRNAFFPCAFLLLFEETNDEEMNCKKTAVLIHNVL